MTSAIGNLAAAVSMIALTASAAQSDTWKSSYTIHGDPGLIDMPTAGRMDDGALVATGSKLGPNMRGNLAFQMLPRVTGVLRYSFEKGVKTKQSVDLRVRVLDETRVLPAVSVGMRNVIGNRADASEYIVASKTLGSKLQVTGGVGWGRMATRNGFGNSVRGAGSNGVIRTSPMFQGPAAPFAGLEYTLTPSLRIKAEYSSDAYVRETQSGAMRTPRSPFNFGMTWSPNRMVQLGAYAIQGTDYGVTASILINPNSAYALRGADPAPLPVAVPDAAAAASWAPSPTYDTEMASVVATAMENEGLTLRGMQTRGNVMRVRYENTRYHTEAQAMGRLARVLSQVAPAGVTEFQMEPVGAGGAKSQLVLQRADLVALENELGAADKLLARVDMREPGPDAGLTKPAASEPRFGWGIAPYFQFASVGQDKEFRYHVGARLSVNYALTQNLKFSAAVNQRALGNMGKPVTAPLAPVAGIPTTRTDGHAYYAAKGPQLDHMALTYMGRAAPGVYAKVTAGYLERAYGGISAEVLWKPVDSRVGLGAEVTYAAKRDYTGLGFQSYRTTTGLVSAYYEFDNDYVARADAGRYLAGDWGGGLSLAREFPNGWKVAGYVTMTKAQANGRTNVDRGVTVDVPMNWLLGTPSRKTRTVPVSSISADYGQRVDTGAGLYALVRDGHRKNLKDSWGRFWK